MKLSDLQNKITFTLDNPKSLFSSDKAMEKMNDEIIEAIKKYVEFNKQDIQIDVQETEKKSKQIISIRLTKTY